MNISSHKNLAVQRGFCQRPDVPTTIQHRNRGKKAAKVKKGKKERGTGTGGASTISPEKRRGKKTAKGQIKSECTAQEESRMQDIGRTGQKKKKRKKRAEGALRTTKLYISLVSITQSNCWLEPQLLSPPLNSPLKQPFLQHLAARCQTDGRTDRRTDGPTVRQLARNGSCCHRSKK